MIFGRSAALWLGLIQAGINVAVYVANIGWTADQVLVLNAFGASIVGVVANVSATGTAFGKETISRTHHR
jgi:hypothetical protein